MAFVCSASGRPRPQISWLRDGMRLGNSSHYMMYDSGVLLIREITIQESGQYKCIAENPAGAREGSLSLYVKYRHAVIGELQFINPGLHERRKERKLHRHYYYVAEIKVKPVTDHQYDT